MNDQLREYIKSEHIRSTIMLSLQPKEQFVSSLSDGEEHEFVITMCPEIFLNHYKNKSYPPLKCVKHDAKVISMVCDNQKYFSEDEISLVAPLHTWVRMFKKFLDCSDEQVINFLDTGLKHRIKFIKHNNVNYALLEMELIENDR